MIDRVTQDYLDQCLGGNKELLGSVNAAPYGAALKAAYQKVLLPKPFFVPDSSVQACVRDLEAVFKLLVDLPVRLFEGDTRKYCEALGLDYRRQALIQRFSGAPTLYGRADLYHDGQSFKLLEFNVDSAMGGIDRSEISRALLQVDSFREFADRHGLGYTDTGEILARTFRKAAESITTGSDPVVAFVDANGEVAKYLPMYRSYKEAMERHGIEVVLGEIGQIREQSGRLHLKGRRVDVVLRCFSADEIVRESNGEESIEPILRAHEDGGVVLWTTLNSGLVHNKSALSFLSDPCWGDAFSKDERALIDGILPWTRKLSDGKTEADGETVDLISWCMEHQDNLIIKPSTGYSGIGITAGWEVSTEEWGHAIRRGLARQDIVQRRVLPRLEPVVDPASGEVTYWDAVWGLFMTPHGFAGSTIRAAPRNQRGVINLGADMSGRVASVFHYDIEPW
ncbi:hypothetical protein ACWDBD_32345 [Streptomyces sp. NPDC001118]